MLAAPHGERHNLSALTSCPPQSGDSSIEKSYLLLNINDIKRYLQVATIASDGLIVVRKAEPFSAAREYIVVPRTVFPGLVTCALLACSLL